MWTNIRYMNEMHKSVGKWNKYLDIIGDSWTKIISIAWVKCGAKSLDGNKIMLYTFVNISQQYYFRSEVERVKGCYIIGSAGAISISGNENGGQFRSCLRLAASFGTRMQSQFKLSSPTRDWRTGFLAYCVMNRPVSHCCNERHAEYYEE
jgi:hypothetical protein